jgi:hypothetical protein
MKKRYLIVHDYGMGGVWGVMTARSGQEICQKYPGVKILEVRPAWMSDADYDKILSNNSFAINDEPRGWLARLGNP